MNIPRPARHSSPRLYVASDLLEGTMITLSKDQSHYLIRVMRRETGDNIIVFNGRDGEWLCTIAEASKSACTLNINNQLRKQVDETDIWLVFAPIKKSRMDFMIEKSCELGVSRILPVLTQNTDKGRINRERLQATAVEASEQCERLSVPIIEQACQFDELLSNWSADRRLLYLDETGKGAPLTTILTAPSADAILVGPEGGFSADELTLLRNLPYSCGISLGPRILRSETAALTALACWQSIVGDTCNSRLR